MTEKEMNALLHELRCRDEYCLQSSGERYILRELWEDLPQEREVLKTLWGPLFPDDLAGVLVLAFGAGTTLSLFIGRFHNEDCAACCGAFRPLVQNYFAHMFSLCQMLLVD